MEACRVIHEDQPDMVEATAAKLCLNLGPLGEFEVADFDGLGTLLHAYKEAEMKDVREVHGRPSAGLVIMKKSILRKIAGSRHRTGGF